MQSLKSYFCNQRGQVKASERTGSSTEDLFVSKWRFYKKLDFLNDVFTSRQSVSSQAPIQPFWTPTEKKGKRTQDNALEMITGYMGTIASSVQQPTVVTRVRDTCDERTEDDIFGELMVKKLKKMMDGLEKENLKLKFLTDLNNAVFE